MTSSLTTQTLVNFLSETVINLKSKVDHTIIVSFIGGAASGKGTITRLLVACLNRQGITSDVISTDDYVVGDRAFRRANFEGREPLAKYDFALLNSKLKDIVNNSDSSVTVAVPTYDEFTGIAVAEGEQNYKRKSGLLKY